jgi:hypothetical protein
MGNLEPKAHWRSAKSMNELLLCKGSGGSRTRALQNEAGQPPHGTLPGTGASFGLMISKSSKSQLIDKLAVASTLVQVP